MESIPGNPEKKVDDAWKENTAKEKSAVGANGQPQPKAPKIPAHAQVMTIVFDPKARTNMVQYNQNVNSRYEMMCILRELLYEFEQMELARIVAQGTANLVISEIEKKANEPTMPSR